MDLLSQLNGNYIFCRQIETRLLTMYTSQSRNSKRRKKRISMECC